MKIRFNVLLFVIIVLLGTMPVCGEILYEVINLGTLTGYNRMEPWGLNNNGQVVGNAIKDYEDGTAFLFNCCGGRSLIDLDGSNSIDSVAMSINDNGQIAGVIYDASGTHVTLLDSSGGGNNTLIYNGGFAWSINDYGIIAGRMNSGDVHIAALFDSQNPLNYVGLGSLSGFNGSEAMSVNNNSQAVGYAYDSNNQLIYDTRAVLFDANNPQNNKDLGSITGYEAAVAFSINENGQIVGRANHQDMTIYDYIPRAVLFDPCDSNSNIDLGTVDGIAGAEALSINNQGQIVGRAVDYSTDFSEAAVLFDPSGNGNNINLNDLIDPALDCYLERAQSIHDEGWIVCWARNSNYEYFGVLLKPVSEMKEGDLNYDCKVDFQDFAIFAAAWRSEIGESNWNEKCDISPIGYIVIDEFDLEVFCDNWLF